MLKRFMPVMAALICGIAITAAGSALAKGNHKHHSGAQLLGSKLNTDGKHELHKAAGHTVHAHVANKKLTKIGVTGPKGEVAVKKYRSSKKMADLSQPGRGVVVNVSMNETAQVSSDYVGYAFTDPVTGDTYIYWFPADVVYDPLTGAEVYVAPV
jgi:hypothetical protein